MEILWYFQGEFWKNLRRITETSNNVIEKLQRNPKEILEILGRSRKYAQRRFDESGALWVATRNRKRGVQAGV